MADLDWNLLAQAPNAGQAFANAFNDGMKQNALSAFAMNPNDPNAQGMAARYDPGAVLEQRQQQQQLQAQQAQQQEQEWTKYAGNLAKWADTPDKRNQAIDYLLSHNHPDIDTQSLLAMKNMNDDQWQAARAHFMAAAGVSDDDGGKDQPPVQKLHDYYVSIGRPDLAEAALVNGADKPEPIQTANPDGTIRINWVRPPLPSQAAQSQPFAGGPPPAAIAYLRAHPETAAQFVQKYFPDGNGGQSASPTGGFR